LAKETQEAFKRSVDEFFKHTSLKPDLWCILSTTLKNNHHTLRINWKQINESTLREVVSASCSNSGVRIEEHVVPMPDMGRKVTLSLTVTNYVAQPLIPNLVIYQRAMERESQEAPVGLHLCAITFILPGTIGEHGINTKVPRWHLGKETAQYESLSMVLIVPEEVRVHTCSISSRT
jgi:hypothetical protein